MGLYILISVLILIVCVLLILVVLVQNSKGGGLASNFAAVRALVSVGIQKGHMKMHLSNIMNQLQIPEEKRGEIQAYFQDKTVSFSAVHEYWLAINK